jgi:hypothetical protein
MLRQNKARGQLRLLPKTTMPRASLEADLVIAIRKAIAAFGLVHWTGRMFVSNHHPPYLPVLGPGTPDILVLSRKGVLLGIECKRDASSKLSESQKVWQARYPTVKVAEVRTVEEAAQFLKENALSFSSTQPRNTQ